STLNGHPFEPSPTFGLPLLTELPYWLEAEVRHIYEGGDHSVVVAEVVEAGVRQEAKPLIMWDTGWFYGG
ncbi:flavin reductase family protein, partial [Acinetobacter baumannii]